MHFSFLSSKQWARINCMIFTAQGNNNPTEDLIFFFLVLIRAKVHCSMEKDDCLAIQLIKI